MVLVRGKEDDKLYVLKVLKKSKVAEMNQIERIQTEKEIMMEVNHPFIVRMKCSF